MTVITDSLANTYNIHDAFITDDDLATRQRSLDERDGQFDLGGLPISSRSGFTTRPVPQRHALRVADRSSGRIWAGGSSIKKLFGVC